MFAAVAAFRRHYVKAFILLLLATLLPLSGDKRPDVGYGVCGQQTCRMQLCQRGQQLRADPIGGGRPPLRQPAGLLAGILHSRMRFLNSVPLRARRLALSWAYEF